MNVTFLEQTPYFSKTSLQGEKDNEDQFWHISTPIPNIFFPDITLSDKETELFIKEKIGQPNLSMTEINES